jgi:sec-independent protein translocase protein TatA
MVWGVHPVFALVGTPGWPEIIAILVLVLIFFGPRRLPEVAEAIGKSIRKFKGASRDVQREIEKGMEEPDSETPRSSAESRKEQEPRS